VVLAVFQEFEVVDPELQLAIFLLDEIAATYRLETLNSHALP
jgi:hypothetical protein